MKVDEARKLLGPDYNQMSDKQIEDIIGLVSAVCHIVVDDYTRDPEGFLKKEQPESKLNKERHLANRMPRLGALDEKIKRHIEHVAHCKCRPMPESIKKEIQKRIALQSK